MKRGSKGIPDNLKSLAKGGARVRFNGFWLNDSERDRTIAAWLDETDGAASVVKELIFRYITGAPVVQNLDARSAGSERVIGEAGRILGDMDD